MRHPSLITLTHDHHHGLAHARSLKAAAGADPDARLELGRAFKEFFHAETVVHFAEEEEQVFPMVLGHSGEAKDVVVQLLDEHGQMRGLVAQLDIEIEQGRVDGETIRRIGELLESHIRTEERTLFPLMEASVPEDELRSLAFATRDRGAGD